MYGLAFRLLFFSAGLVATTAQAAITADISPARTSGVAPLAVFFDATGTIDTDGSTNDFHDLTYSWDFDDPDAGTWSFSGLSKNVAFGPVAGHVFETAGTYGVEDRGNVIRVVWYYRVVNE